MTEVSRQPSLRPRSSGGWGPLPVPAPEAITERLPCSHPQAASTPSSGGARGPHTPALSPQGPPLQVAAATTDPGRSVTALTTEGRTGWWCTALCPGNLREASRRRGAGGTVSRCRWSLSRCPHQRAMDLSSHPKRRLHPERRRMLGESGEQLLFRPLVGSGERSPVGVRRARGDG